MPYEFAADYRSPAVSRRPLGTKVLPPPGTPPNRKELPHRTELPRRPRLRPPGYIHLPSIQPTATAIGRRTHCQGYAGDHRQNPAAPGTIERSAPSHRATRDSLPAHRLKCPHASTGRGQSLGGGEDEIPAPPDTERIGGTLRPQYIYYSRRIAFRLFLGQSPRRS